MKALTQAPRVFKLDGKNLALWFVLLGLATVLRLAPIGSGLPYIDYVDEGHMLHAAIRIATGKSDTSLLTYPPLTSYLIAGAIKCHAPFYRTFHHHKLWKDLPADRDFQTELGQHYDLITPSDVIWLGRFVIACLSIGTVILTGALAQLLGGWRVKYLAMLFVALSPALVRRGSIVIVDTTATFLILTALYFCQRLRVVTTSAAMWRNAAFAGFASGLAFGAKYTVGVVFAAVLVTIVTVSVPKKFKLILIFIAGVGLIVGMFCGVAEIACHPEKIVEELRFAVRFYTTVPTPESYWSAAISGWEIGVPLMITGFAGTIRMFSNVLTRRVVISWIVFALLLGAAVGWARFQPFRNLLSLVPLLCIAAALFCDWLGAYLASRSGLRSLVPLLILVVTFSLAWFSVRFLKLRMSHVDARVRAIDWLQQHATKNDVVLGIRELSILPAEWQRVAARVSVVPWFQAADLLRRQQFDYLVTGKFDLRYAVNPAVWSAYRDRWEAETSILPVHAEFGETATPVVLYLWRTNDERILILKGNRHDKYGN